MKRSLLILGLIAVALILLAAVNYIIIRTNGTPVAVPDIPRSTETFGDGEPLQYVVLGDSTAVSQGGAYDQGYARATTRYLADRGYRVGLTNVAVSGARADDVEDRQVPQAAKLRPDIALLAVGANDVTHFSRVTAVRESLRRSIAALRAANPDIRIVLTGSPQMGTVDRFPQPAKRLARLRTDSLNRMVRQLSKDENVIFAPIAEKTGPLFDARPGLYAADKFHPNTAGYTTWVPVLNDALGQALRQPGR